MTTTTKTETPTAAMLARLAALDMAPDFGHMAEILPWSEASRVGSFELPGSVINIVTMAAHLGEQAAGNVKPQPPANAVLAILAGGDVDEAIAADAAYAAAVARHTERARLLLAATGRLQSEALAAFVPHRDSLVVGPLRESVAALLKQAKSQAKTLQAFAPNFEPALLAEGNAEELETWRRSRQVQRDFEVMLRAWSTSWFAATRHGRGTIELQFYPVRPGLWYAWTDPLAVPDESLRIGRDVEVLRIAAAPSEYRLLAPCEFQPVLAAADAANPPTETTSAALLMRRLVCT
jgi:hypothetical protein